MVAEARGALKRGRTDERVLRERAELRLVVSDPGTITVSVHDGAAVLEGAVLEGEVDALRSAVARVRGVRSVEDRLERHVAPARSSGYRTDPVAWVLASSSSRSAGLRPPDARGCGRRHRRDERPCASSAPDGAA